MSRIQLTINGTTRWIDALQYEYFNPVCKSEAKYRKTLQKNFPYDFGDDTDLSPYSTVTLPTLTTDALAKRLSDDAKWEDKTSLKIGFALYYKYGRYAERLSAQDVLNALDSSMMTESKRKHVCLEE